MTIEHLGFSSRAIHAGQEPDPTTGAVVPAIHQVSTYKQDGARGRPPHHRSGAAPHDTAGRLEADVPATETDDDDETDEDPRWGRARERSVTARTSDHTRAGRPALGAGRRPGDHEQMQ